MSTDEHNYPTMHRLEIFPFNYVVSFRLHSLKLRTVKTEIHKAENSYEKVAVIYITWKCHC